MKARTRKHRRQRPRRGVLLLVVLSVLVLFLLIAVTYVVVAGHYRATTESFARSELAADDPPRLLDKAMEMFLVGPLFLDKAPQQQVEPLLRDKYGLPMARGTITSAETAAGGQFVQLRLNANSWREDYTRLGGCNGLVFTVLSGPAQGISTRITNHFPADGTIHVEPLQSDSGQAITSAQLNGQHFLINGRPFDGSDHYTTAGGQVVARNEDYDASDEWNLYLAFVPVRSDLRSEHITPSFHRPGWINQIVQQNGGTLPTSSGGYPAGALLRPMPWDHPNFTGSNPAFFGTSAGQLANALLRGPWDVDNDGDGVPDSIWVDLGMPPRQLPDGRWYKPLFAFLCQDLDGRLNLNAHGSLVQVPGSPYYQPVSGTFAGGGTNHSLPRGQGYGPADVDLGTLFAAEISGILQGRYGQGGRPGAPNVDDALSVLKNVGYPQNYLAQASAYGSPPDLWGRGALALGPNGHPLTHFMAQPDENVDDPYEIDLSLGASRRFDTPFTLAEQERLLRYYDADAFALPERLFQAAPTAFGNALHRRRVTVMSSSFPGRTQPLPGKFREIAESGNLAEMAKVVAFELIQGMKLDVNRLFGNQIDDTGNGIVDQPGEGTESNPEPIWPGAGGPYAAFGAARMNYTNDDPTSLLKNNWGSRQLLARHLYCLMLAIVEESGYRFPFEESLSAEERYELTRRRIAQWAINVVDFRDSDSIMTPFEYDIDPLTNGWDANIDGNPSTTNDSPRRRIVWGTEYPDLILTEAIAFHDRRVKDTKHDTGPAKTRRVLKPGSGGLGGGGAGAGAGGDDDPEFEMGDPTLDQYRIPQGSLFIELYATGPRYQNNPQAPRELYVENGGQLYLDLSRMAPAGSDGRRYPVWRIAISEPHHQELGEKYERSALIRSGQVGGYEGRPDSTSFEPRNMNLLSGAPEPLQIERIIWFANQNPAGYPEEGTVFYAHGSSGTYLATGGYAVVGPRQTTYVGSSRDPDNVNRNTPAEQRIVLDPGNVTVVKPGNVTDDSASTLLSSGRIRPPMPIIATAPPPGDWSQQKRNSAAWRVGVNVSEPLPREGVYYAEPNPTNDPNIPDSYYDNPEAPSNLFPHEPLDSRPGMPLRQHNLLGTGTTQNFKTAFLQRLANPLMAYHPDLNPYVTVDWMPIDLTVFNGEDYNSEQAKGANIDPGNRPWDENNPEGIGPYDPDDPEPDTAPPVHFETRRRGIASGSRTNVWTPRFTPPAKTEHSGSAYFSHPIRQSMGYLNREFGEPMTQPGYVGEPQTPFPWMTWLNRPFASAMELMLVPASPQGRLLHEFSIDDKGANPYSPDLDVPPAFGHLLNFLDPEAEFYRLFDYVDVPSRFVNTEVWYNPAVFAQSDTATLLRKPPYNKNSRFRDPGRVNVNTVPDETVWQSVTRGIGPRFNELDESRRGYAYSDAQPFSSQYRSQFGRPFRGFRKPAYDNSTDEWVENTLLRPHVTDRDRPLLSYRSSAAYNDTSRNPFFAYDGPRRLQNLLTTHSNVFAVWVTVGYFELEPPPGSTETTFNANWRLGQELGADSGDARRHRAFYIIDRTVPVAFEPGERHNVDRAVLLKRQIE